MGTGNERGSGNKMGAQRAEQFPHLGNYTLTPAVTTLSSAFLGRSWLVSL